MEIYPQHHCQPAPIAFEIRGNQVLFFEKHEVIKFYIQPNYLGIVNHTV